MLNLDFDPNPELDPAQLLARLDRFFLAVDEVAPQISFDVLHKNLPGRNRTILQLLHHTVDVARPILFADEIPKVESDDADSSRDSSKSLANLSRKIHSTRSSIQATTTNWQSTRDTAYGLQTMHQVLERCTWHVAQHIRQLEHFCVQWQQPIRGWPSHTDYERLPLPNRVWDD